MGEVAESEYVAAQCFEMPVDGFGGVVGGVVVEEGQDVVAAAPQGTAELGDLLQPDRDTVADRVDDRGHGAFAGSSIGVGERGDDGDALHRFVRRRRVQLTAIERAEANRRVVSYGIAFASVSSSYDLKSGFIPAATSSHSTSSVPPPIRANFMSVHQRPTGLSSVK